MSHLNIRRFLWMTIVALVWLGAPGEVSAHEIKVKKTPGKLRFGAVDEDSIYAKAGIQRNDVIREIDGKPVDETTPIAEVETVVRKGGRMTIERNGKLIRKNLKPLKEEDPGDPLPLGD